jgi:hypothetical protein
MKIPLLLLSLFFLFVESFKISKDAYKLKNIGNHLHRLKNSLPFDLSNTNQDILISTSLVGEVYVWLKLWSTLAAEGILPSNLTRCYYLF